MDTPHFSLVPLDFDQNLEWRRRIIQEGASCPRAANQLTEMFRQDLLLWLSTVCWTHDPRIKNCPYIPFIPYEYQQEYMLQIADAVGNHDLLIEKSRDMGASWMVLMVLLWYWHFVPGQGFLVGSRK